MNVGDTGHTGGIFPISSEETRETEGEEHYRQKSGIETTANSVYTILQQEQQQPIGHQHNLLYSCYHCDNFETNTKQDYESHVIFRHPHMPGYPSKADLRMLGIQGKGKEWEI